MKSISSDIKHIIPDIKRWPIYKFSRFREEFIEDLNEYTKKNLLYSDAVSIVELLEKTVYLEKLRVKNNPWSVDPNDEKTYWKELSKEIADTKNKINPDMELEKILERVINRYNQEIVGGFRVKTFRFARKFLTSLFKRIYNSFGEKLSGGLWGNKRLLLDKINVIGAADEMRDLFAKGTIVLLPTHSSNLDSILVGYTIDSKVKVPAFVYGAGLNLFNYELPAYFMNRLGTYKVDRRKKNPIYLECLKSTSSFSLQAGVNNLFFPGGTRSRNGRIEDRLKLGLLGSVVEAQRNAFLKDSTNKIYIFPVVLSYHFTFEAQGLIDQYLKRMAREKYTKATRQVKQSGYILKFIRALFRQRSNYTFSIGNPIDVFGNAIDSDGNSLDKNGEILNIKGYFKLDGNIEAVKQREKIYTKRLGESIAEQYFKYNVVLTSQLLAYVAFKVLVLQNRDLDIYDILNLPAADLSITSEKYELYLDKMLSFLKTMEENCDIILSDELHGSLESILEDGLYHLGAYHPEKVLLLTESGRIESKNFRLLYYYHNRLDSYEFDIEKIFDIVEFETVL